MKRQVITVNKKHDGYRLDVTIAESGLDLSRRKIRSIIDVGGVYVNKKRVRIASRTVHEGDRIELDYDLQKITSFKRPTFKLTEADILFEDEHVLVLNKPAGLPTQATREQSVMHVIPLLKKLFEELNRPKIDFALVHRLDMETSGALIVAKNAEAADYIGDQFRQHTVEKVYHAIASGVAKEKKFKVECQLSAIQPKIGIVKVVNRSGKSSLTHFKVECSNAALKLHLISCAPVTGRTHQIRVHLDHVGLPIVGDKKYGRNKVKLSDELAALASTHQFLHAHTITFSPASGEASVSVSAPYPEDMVSFLKLAKLAPSA